jgi:hypothetical protein
LKELKELDRKDPNAIIAAIKEFEARVGQPQYDIPRREDIKVNLRVDEKIGPAMFKSDPLVPGSYLANSLTLRAMRPDIFVLGESIEDLSATYKCICGKDLDLQFWRLCPYCARSISS